MKQEPTTDYKQHSDETDNNLDYSSSLWHGLGLFGESYLLFSIGILRPLWQALYPACFDEDDSTECARPYLSYKSMTYSVVFGVMLGMILLGILANTLGRRRGSIITASLMAGGAMCMTLSSVILSNSPSILFPVMSVFLFLFGIGVGGEYPLSASSASERAMAAMRRRRDKDLDHEGRMQRLLSGEEADGKSSWQMTRQHNETLSPMNTKLRPIEESHAVIPLSPTNVTDGTNNSTNSRRWHTRGKEVLIVFSMQGAGIFANSLLLTFLLMVTKRRGVENKGNDEYDDGYDHQTLLNIWRITYAVGSMVLVYVLVSRVLHLTESEVWAQDRKQRGEEQDARDIRACFIPPDMGRIDDSTKVINSMEKSDHVNDMEIGPALSSITLGSQFDALGSTNLDGCKIVPTVVESMMELKANAEGTGSGTMPWKAGLLFQYYGVRLFGTSATWLLWDIAFYGNKLFQSSFLIVLTGEDASLVEITGASAINAFVALLGYYFAAAIIDDPDVGRLSLQLIGFVITGSLFLLCGSLSDRLSSTWLIIMYFGSSFFGQCGPNCTTFLIPAEVFPTEMRTMCHGISASAGKLGALIASILFNFVSQKQAFIYSGYASFVACMLTFITIPETTTLDLYEIDKQWRMILDGRKFDYEGPANDPRHLSFCERNQNKFCCRK